MARPAGMSDDDSYDSYDEYDVYDDYEIDDQPAIQYTNAEVIPATNILVSQFDDAVVERDLKLVAKLLQQHQNDETFGNNALNFFFFSIMKCDEDILKLYFQNDYAANVNFDYNTSLMILCTTNHGSVDNLLNCFKILRDYTPHLDLNVAYQPIDTTPLMLACQQNRVELVNELIKLGADFQKSDQNGQNCLFYAAFKGRKNIVKYLLNLEIDINLKNVDNKTAYDVSVEFGYPDIKEMILKSHDIFLEDDNFRFKHLPTLDYLKNGFENIVYDLLRAMELGQYVENFRKNSISLYDFLTLNDARLKEIGIIATCHRLVILNWIEKLNFFHYEPDALPIKFGSEFSLKDVADFLASVTLHMCMMRSTLRYIEVNCTDFIDNEEVESIFHETNKLKSCLEKYMKMVDEIQRKEDGAFLTVDLIANNSAGNIKKMSFRKILTFSGLILGISLISFSYFKK